MIEIIEGLPDNVVGIVATGRVTNRDCDEVLMPAMARSLQQHERLRLYYELCCRFPGAAWEDLKVGLECLPHWERVAVVTDVGWVRHTVNALRFLIPGEIRVFASAQATEGLAWITDHPA
ncbi:MAG: STAS/SEC14 domain-containing protein [Alphaproteobacteria bacterium]|nr:STAS/SEC14 domain-containing protein [Alphaproteobacteria bacterium]